MIDKSMDKEYRCDTCNKAVNKYQYNKCSDCWILKWGLQKIESHKVVSEIISRSTKQDYVKQKEGISLKQDFRDLIKEKYRCAGKTEARMFFYDHAKERLGDSFYTDKHIVIASTECGDIDYLKGHHVPIRNIIACDTDPLAIMAAKAWGVEISPHSSIQETIPWAKERDIATINVDLTHTLGIGSYILQQVLRNAPKKSVISYTYLRGRDQFKSDIERTNYLTMLIGKPIKQFNYQSKTHISPGSSMTVAIMQ